MTERIFTVFDGPDAGATFALADRPITLGREPGRDVVLHDDRASRLHARLVPDEQGVLIVDQNSANGTFVNGIMVRERRLDPGDIIGIGVNRIFFGPGRPSRRLVRERLASASRGAPPAPLGTDTQHLAGPPTPPLVSRQETSLGTVLQAVADAALSVAASRGIHVSVESELQPDRVFVDPQLLYRALAGLVAGLLKLLPQTEGTLALRSAPDLARAGFHVEVLCVGMSIPREGIAAAVGEGAFRDAQSIAAAHAGSLDFLPPGAPDICACLRLPIGPTDATKPTLIRTDEK
jgi:pSer/pThr/pTyr-binding forkhead associated (FHA) protein